MESHRVPESPVTVKGSPIRSLLKFVEGELTAAQREELFSRLPPDDVVRLRARILVTDALPVALLNRLTVEAAKVKQEPLQSFSRRAGRAAASEAFSGVYRVFALILTPEKLLEKASRIWGSLYNRGELVVERKNDRSAHIQLLDFPSEEAGCARITGWIERMVELTGVKSPRIVQTRCFAKGAPACEWDLQWD